MVKKRGQNEGGIYQRDDGTWEAKVSLGYDSSGKRIRKSLYGASRVEVRAKLEKILKDHADGIAPDAGRETLEHFLDRWLTDVVKPHRAPKTYEQYEYLCRVHITPALGRTHLDKLTPERIQRFLVGKRADGLSAETVARMRAVLRVALERALRWGMVMRNAANLTDPPRSDPHEVEPLTLDEVKALFTAVKGDRLEALYVVAVATGLRQGELLGLRWGDVDLEEKTITVRTQVQRVEGKLMLRELKTRSSRAVVPLASFAVTALRKHRVHQNAERLAADAWHDYNLVFPTSVGTPIERGNLVQHWHRVRERAKIPPRRFHDLRHTCASLLHVQGVPAKDIQAILRHAQLAITMDLYTHVFAEQRRATADAMDIVLQSTVNSGGRKGGRSNAKAGA